MFQIQSKKTCLFYIENETALRLFNVYFIHRKTFNKKETFLKPNLITFFSNFIISILMNNVIIKILNMLLFIQFEIISVAVLRLISLGLLLLITSKLLNRMNFVEVF